MKNHKHIKNILTCKNGQKSNQPVFFQLNGYCQAKVFIVRLNLNDQACFTRVNSVLSVNEEVKTKER